MKYYWIFDLDDTLLHSSHYMKLANRSMFQHQNSSNENIFYRLIQKNNHLIDLFNRIQDPKLILSNGSYLHVHKSLLALGLYESIQLQIDSNTIQQMYQKYPQLAIFQPYHQNIPHQHCYKPHSLIYQFVELLLQHYYHFNTTFTTNKSILFFDDRPENFIYPHQIGWTTIWISNNKQLPNKYEKYIHHSFINIESAIRFFMNE